jgi:hypothetical protein
MMASDDKFNHQVCRAGIIVVALGACLVFGIIILASGDWLPGGIIVAASTVSLASKVPAIRNLCRTGSPASKGTPRNGQR